MHDRACPISEFVPAHLKFSGISSPHAASSKLVLLRLSPAPTRQPDEIVVQESHFISSIVFLYLHLGYLFNGLSLHSSDNFIFSFLIRVLSVNVILGIAIPLGEQVSESVKVEVSLDDAPD